jgi:hypothetical protein
MGAERPASVEERFSSRAGLGASESTQASEAGGQPGAAGKGRAGSAPVGLAGADRLAGPVFRNVPRSSALGEKGPSARFSLERVQRAAQSAGWGLSILSDVALFGTINVTYNTAFEVVLFLTSDGSSPTSTNACPGPYCVVWHSWS